MRRDPCELAELAASFGLLPAIHPTGMTARITAQMMGSRPIYELLLNRTLKA